MTLRHTHLFFGRRDRLSPVDMGYSVPTKNSAMDAGKVTAIDGGALALGETFGRSLLGPGLGTAIGGAAVAASQSGQKRDMMALVAGERGMSELFAGGSGGGSRQGVK